jgi:tetratricopeptide (TPR) repeat protein
LSFRSGAPSLAARLRRAGRASTDLLDAVLPAWPDAAEEPERRQLLLVTPRSVHFRHELARHAVRNSIPIAARRRLHREILDVLLAEAADPADIVHHAEAAGADAVVGEYALIAARRAHALGSTREALAHYQRAADFAALHRVPERALLFQDLATLGYLNGRPDLAMKPIQRAIALFEAAGDVQGVGRCIRKRSRLHWFRGEAPIARQAAREAVHVLEPEGETPDLAFAFSNLSELFMLDQDYHTAVQWGERALELATRLGDDFVRSHALVNLGSADLLRGPDETQRLEAAVAFADAVNEPHESVRGLTNWASTLFTWHHPARARRMAARGEAYAVEREMHALVPYFHGMLAWLDIRQGRWESADRLDVPDEKTINTLLARTVLAERAVRRGDDDAQERLEDVTRDATKAGEPSRLLPVLWLHVERALLAGGPPPVDGLRALVERDAGPYSAQAAGALALLGEPSRFRA